MARNVEKEKEFIGSVDSKQAEKELERVKKEAIKRIKDGGNFILAVEGQCMCCGELTDSIASMGLLMDSFKSTAGDECFDLALKVMNAESDEELKEVYDEIMEYDFKKKINEQIGIPTDEIDEFLKVIRKFKPEVEDETETV